MIHEEKKFYGKYSKTLLDTLYQSYRPELKRGLSYLILGFLGLIALLANANFIGYWVDSFCDLSKGICRPIPNFLVALDTEHFVALLFVLTVVGFIFTLIFRTGLSRLSARAVSRIYDETTLRTSRLPMTFFDHHPAGRVMTRFSSDYNSIFRIFGGPLAEFIGLIFDFLAMSILIGFASPHLLPFWAAQAVINFGIYKFFVKRLRERRRESARLRSPAIAHFAESANGVSSINAYQRAPVFERRFIRLNTLYLKERMKSITTATQFALCMGFTTVLVFLAMGFYSAHAVATGQLSVGSIGVGFAYLGLSTHIIQAFFDWLGQFEEAMTGLERMNEYLRLPLENGSKLPASARFHTGHDQEKVQPMIQPPIPIGDGQGHGVSIELNHLSLRYGPELPWVLKDVSLTISPGEKIAVIGKTGSGKTSLVQALFQLYPLDSGTVKIAGRNTQDLDLESYRSLISYINQEATLFMGTLRENLSSDPTILDGTLIQALKRVQFLSPGATDAEYLHWLDYVLEEKGRNLSLGERQLVCMTRCLLQNAPIVILDEATSSVDPQSEAMMTKATEEFFQGRTQMIIAHRLSSIRSCDRVLWLSQGKVHRLGPPSEVLPEFEKALLEV